MPPLTKDPQTVVDDPARLDAVRTTGLLDSESEEAFDRMARLAARLTGAPVTFISLVDENRDFYKACYGFPEPLASQRQLTGTTFCHYAIRSTEPLAIEDTMADEEYRSVPTVKSLGVRAYLGIPLVTAQGLVLGSFCAIDFAPRKWSPGDIESMKELATSTMREIELRAAQATLSAERRLLEATVRHMPVGILVATPDGKVALSNARATAILGRDFHDLGEVASFAVSHPDGSPYRREERPLVRALRGEVVHDEHAHLERGGSTRIVRINAAPVMDGDELIAALVVYEDITDHENMRRHLDAESSRLRTVLESVPAGVLVAEAPSGRIIVSNRKSEEILGEPALELADVAAYGRWKGFDGDGKSIAADEWPIARALRGETTRGVEVQYQRPGGECIWVAVHGAPVYDAAGNLIGGIVVFHDINEQREIRSENKRLYEEAEQANRAKDDFFAAVTHELRTPMTSIIGWTRILKMETLDSPDAVEAADMIESSARMQARLVDDLLDVSRIASKKITLDRRIIDIDETIDEAVRAAEPAAGAQGVRLRTKLESHASVDADRSRIRQILGNLLANAIKFTPEGGLVAITSRVNDRDVEICIADTGRGIAADLLPEVFQRGRQAHNAEHGGLGLGLTIVRHLVELHDGTVRAESEGAGKGATFVVTFPLGVTS